jgi:DNA-binding transcriptional ArsR family regulator
LLRIEVGPNDLAASRFALAPLVELEHLLRKLDRPGSAATSGVTRTSRWARRYIAVRSNLDSRALRALRPAGNWGVDFITPPPSGMARSPSDDLDAVRSTPLALARRQIRQALALTGPVDADVAELLGRRDIVPRLADALERSWNALIAPDWPHLLAITERDVLHRAERLARGGWAAALEGLHPTLRWEDGSVVIRGRPDGVAALDGRGLIFVPSVFCYPRTATYLDPPWQPAIVYPARGSAALWQPHVSTPTALARLLGAARADLLTRLDTPASTTQLVGLTGFALGAVGDHLRVLREAGLVAGTRTGQSVMYSRTPVGDAIVGAIDTN